MITKTYHLQFITPCFCAGASQEIAEVRAPSIRGKLRWWFRVLGGSRQEEADVFGSIARGVERASALVVRVQTTTLMGRWQPVSFGGASNAGYVLYFAKASANGARWNSPKGALPIGSAFELQLQWRRQVSPGAQARFNLALDCFLLLGSLGLRSTRGLGCFECNELPFSGEKFRNLLTQIHHHSHGFLADLAVVSGPQDQLFDALGAQLRGLRTGGYPALSHGRTNPTPLGSSSHPRQTSAVYLRPVKETTGNYRIVVFEAPAEKVLGPESQRGAPRLRAGIPPPQAPPQAPPQRGRGFGPRR